MPTYRYVAKKGPQELLKGVLEGESRAAVLSRLTDLGYTPLQIVEAEGSEPSPTAVVAAAKDRRIASKAFNQFTRQLASLVRAQVPLMRTLSILKDQSGNPRLRGILEAISENLRQGQSLSDSLVNYPRIFSPMYVSLVRAGEIAGALDKVLDRLAAQADRDEALRSKVQAAFVYPAFVAVVGVGTVLFLLTFVMPKLIRLFEGFGGRLPLPTRMLLTLTKWCQQGWFWAALAAALVAVAFWWTKRGAKMRLRLHRLCLKLPMVGQLIRDLELSRFTRSYGLLMDHGIPILQATEVAMPVVRNLVIQEDLKRLPGQLKEGNALASCLQGLTISTPFLVNAVAVGEEGGRVGEALMEVSNYYEREVEQRLQLMASLLEPAMVLLVGGMVGFIVIAVLLPIFEMSVIAR